MKSVGTIAVLILAWSGSALACPHNAQTLLCPGDRVVDPSGYVGHVSAVNAIQKKVAINYGGLGNSFFEISSVALGIGCLEGYCVGDLVVDPSGYKGHIDGVNPHNRTVAINYGGLGNSYFSVDRVFLGFGCMQGYCVGDKVVDPSGYAGKLDAINRYSGEAAVNYGSLGDSIFPIKQLATSESCVTYGDAERAVRLFPEFRTDLYISPELHFTLTRPVR